MNNKGYIKNSQPSTPMSTDTNVLKGLDDNFWKEQAFYCLLSFYQNYNETELTSIIEAEQKKTQSKVEREIAKYVRKWLKNDEYFESIVNFKVIGEATNDEDVEGNYDIIINHSYWKNEFCIECKNLDHKQDLVNKYVCYDRGKKVFDGGVYRFFNGKYANNQSFAGMLGFLLEGDMQIVKNKIMKKLQDKFDISPNGDWKRDIDNSIQGNTFTFDSIHNRNGSEFILHHILFDLKKSN